VTTETFAGLLDAALRHEPGRPLVTAYDEATGARTELSVTTYANWVAKTANLFLDEYLLDPGDTVRLDLPAHWLGPVFVGAAYLAGLSITEATDPDSDPELTVCGPEGLADRDTSTPVLACSLTPFATPFAEALPAGVDDYGKLWPGQSDVFTGMPPEPGSQSTLLAQGRSAVSAGARILTDANLAEPAHQALLVGALAGGGSLVLVAAPRDADWTTRYEAERPTEVRPQPPSR